MHYPINVEYSTSERQRKEADGVLCSALIPQG